MNFMYLKNNSGKIFLIIVAILAAIFMIYPKKERLDESSAYEVLKDDLYNETFVYGKTSPEDIYDLSFKISGRLSEFNLKDGDTVEQGQLLARLDSSSIYSDISKQQSKINIEQKRLLELENSVTEQDLDVLRSEIQRATNEFDNKQSAFGSEMSEAIVSIKDILDTSDFYFNSIESRDGITLDFPNIIMNFADRDNVADARYLLGVDLDQGDASLSSSDVSYDDKYSALDDIFDSTISYLDLFYSSLKDTDQSIDVKQDVFNTKNLVLDEKRDIENVFVALKLSLNGIDVLEKRLAQAEVGSTNFSLDYQEAIVNDKKVELSALYTDLRNYSILSPISGKIYSVNSENFETVSSGEVVISVIEDKPLVIVADVAESDVTYMGIGSIAEVTFDAISDITYRAFVKEIENRPEVRNSVSTYTTTLQFQEDQDISRVLSGMSANISIKSGNLGEVIQAPSSLIYSDQNGSYVMKGIRDASGRTNIEKVYIQKGFTSNAGVSEIKSGLSVGDTIYLK